MAADPFTLRDGERTIRFGRGSAAEASDLLRSAGFGDYALLTTERASGSVPLEASLEIHVPPGLVDEISAALLDDVGGRPLVALGGGRVIDTAKAIGGVTGAQVAAIPTTLSGAELTPFHRTPAGVEGARMVRPSLVVADPELMASQPEPQLWASAMNALAHGMEALYTPLANPVAEAAALRGAEALFSEELALGALLCGWASGMTGFAVHHATCQLLVRTAGSPHAQTNAVMLPHFAGMMSGRVPGVMGEFARALGDPGGDPGAAAGRAAKLSARSGHTRLATLGVEEQHLPPVAAAVMQHPALGNTPDPPDEAELLELLRNAL
ncbi:MAG: maleylacetate reductase [Thermoleophilaceae bacterium]|nr:maleylacetate reductase [Thermoleophilaceae bacterium]MEA2409366.1 maleylacetate reductase [Thermoleophilaceae bacterium]